MSDTYNITIKCDSEQERDRVLDKVDELLPFIVRYHGRNNVFFSENEMKYFSEKMREVT